MHLTSKSLVALTRQNLRRKARFNTIINFVPEKTEFIVERLGKYNRTLDSGMHLVIPFLDVLAYEQNLKEQALTIDHQQAITADNVVLDINGVLYVQVVDSHKCSYGVEDPEEAITQLAQTTMRAAIGSMDLDHCFREREKLNHNIVSAINKAAEKWGLHVLRYEIKDIIAPRDIQIAMEKQVAADREKRATILESEARKIAEINQAEGVKQATIMKAEAEAHAIKMVAEAQALRIKLIGDTMKTEAGFNAASLTIAEQQVSAYKELAKESTTLIIPNQANDIAGTVATAMSTLSSLSKKQPTYNTADIESVLADDFDKFSKMKA